MFRMPHFSNATLEVIVYCAAAVVILFLALHARAPSSAASQAIEPERTAAPVVTTAAPQVEIAPLHPLGAGTTQQQAPPVHTTTRPPPGQTTGHVQNPPNPPPTATQTQSKPDIF